MRRPLFARSIAWSAALFGLTTIAAACTATPDPRAPEGTTRVDEDLSAFAIEATSLKAAGAGGAPASLAETEGVEVGGPKTGEGGRVPQAGAQDDVHDEAGDDAAPACPTGMVRVTGSFCPEVKHTCLRPVDTVGRYAGLRCAVFREPPECERPRVDMSFCIDREEYAAPGESLPMVNVSWTRATELCAARGGRLCKEDEWEFACEGEAMRPYPYGFERDSTACNIDQTHLGRPNQGLRDLRAPLSAFPQCVSPFGVHDLTGNVDEWTEREGARAPHRSALHGGWWLPGRNGCRPATLFHAESYQGKQVGFRCCADAPAARP